VRSGPSSSRLSWILGIAAVIAVLVAAWQVISRLTDDTVRTAVEVLYATPDELIALAQPVVSGNPDATVRVMEFGDYQCPACQNFFRQAKPILDVSYIEPGRIRFEFYDFPLEAAHPNAFVAARAARCAGDQNAYWEFHDVLFTNQLSWAGQADPVSDFAGYASDLGLDEASFRECVRSDRHAQVVSANQLLGLQLGAQSTPTVIIDTGDGRALRVDNWTTGLRPTLDELLNPPLPPEVLEEAPAAEGPAAP
jgi:protein-disulfide isomerase